jgi:hypothetical protein
MAQESRLACWRRQIEKWCRALYEKKKGKELRRQSKTTPHNNQGKEATVILSSIVEFLHQKKKKKINGDQEGCKLAK